MKKLLVITMLLMFGFGAYCEARVQYDSTGRKIIEDNTIRGRKRAAEAQELREQRMQAAAAAKMNYEEAMRYIENRPKTNFYQDRIQY